MRAETTQNTTLRYSVPQDRSIKDKKSIGQYSEDGTIMEYITPWVGNTSSDGLITPNNGWWAFDVDLSLYSGKRLNEDDNIHLQMRSWNVSHISLNSLIAANIDGSIQANIDLLQSQHLSNSMMGIVSKLGSMGANVYAIGKSLETGKWSEAFSTGITMGKTVANLCGMTNDGKWKLIDKKDNADGTVYDLPKTNLAEKTYLINYDAGLCPQFIRYRFEVSATYCSDESSYMQLGELRLNYDTINF